MKVFALTKGLFSVLDDDDYAHFSEFGMWSVDSYGYARNGRRHLHRLVAERHGRDLSADIDHKNRCRRDNRLDNLRPCSRSENNFNTVSRGYTWREDEQRFMVLVRYKRRRYFRGRFRPEQEAEAAAAADALKRELFGEFVNDPLARCPLYGACPECDIRCPGTPDQIAEAASLLPSSEDRRRRKTLIDSGMRPVDN